MSEQLEKVQPTFLGVLDQSINKVFGAKDLLAKDGQTVIGVRLTPMKRKDIAKNMGLIKKEDKAELDEAILKESDGLMRMIKGEVAKLGPEWTAKAAQIRTTKDGSGNRTMVLRFEEVKRKKGIKTDAELAVAMFPEEMYPGMKMEDKIAGIQMLRESQKQQLAGNHTEVETQTESNTVDTSENLTTATQ